MSDEDRGFEVIDKRGGRAKNGGGHPEPPDPEEFGPDEASEGPSMEISVQGVLRFAIEMLSTHAWVSMGLRANPMSGKIDRNLNEARRAIDILADLTRHAESDAEPDEKRDNRNMLSDLRVNFIRQSNQPD